MSEADLRHEPECGEDFCDACGDCLHCYVGDECLESGSGYHTYEDPDDDTKAIYWRTAFAKGVK